MSGGLIKLLICGAGSGAHAFAGIASSFPSTEVRVLSLYKDKAERWNDALKTSDLRITRYRLGQEPSKISSKPTLITNKPEEAVPGCDVIAFVLPAFAHQVSLEAIKPYIEPGVTLVGLPGAAGFEYQVCDVLEEKASQCTIMNFESLPWACRITEFGRECEVLGTKETLFGAMRSGNVPAKKDPVCCLQSLLGDEPKLLVSGHLVGATLMSTNAYLHTSILYSQWHDWDEKPLDEAPLFYHGLTEAGAQLLSKVSDEVVAVAEAIAQKKPEVDTSRVVNIYHWYMRCYPNDIKDKTNLHTAIRTNAGYKGLRHPMKKTTDGKLVPDFTYRYMTEDIPYGLVVIRGIAEIAGVKTPNMDRVMTWAQGKMGKEFLVDSKLQGKDMALSMAPQVYGLTTLKAVLSLNSQE